MRYRSLHSPLDKTKTSHNERVRKKNIWHFPAFFITGLSRRSIRFWCQASKCRPYCNGLERNELQDSIACWFFDRLQYYTRLLLMAKHHCRIMVCPSHLPCFATSRYHQRFALKYDSCGKKGSLWFPIQYSWRFLHAWEETNPMHHVNVDKRCLFP